MKVVHNILNGSDAIIGQTKSTQRVEMVLAA